MTASPALVVLPESRMAEAALTLDVMAVTSPVRHVRPVRPIRFREQEPEDEHLGQSRRHLHLCKALYEILRGAVSLAANTVGADQFVYFRANDVRRCLAPDGFVKLGQPDADFDSWKTWERGAPEVAFEVLSPSDTDESWSLEEKIERYHELGVRELVAFNVDGEPGRRLRVWDRVNGDFVERVVENERTPCLTLGLHLAVAPITVDDGAHYPACVRLARDADATDLLPTTDEARRAADEARRAAERRATDALSRVAALEAELAQARAHPGSSK